MKHAYMKAMTMAVALFALAGCENMKRDQASAMDTSTTYSSTGGGAGATASSSGDMAMAPNAVVVNIEPMSRSSAMAGSSQGGTTGSAMTGAPTDMVHKVTVRMDDGSTRSIVQDMAPTFKSGDRVHVMNNMIHMR
jgi:outer membrane lipoprotein SlyB